MSRTDALAYLQRSTQGDAETDRIKGTLEELREMLTRLEHLVVPELLPQTTDLFDELDNFRVRASLIGQVKAGKTALSNALLGTSNMLPSDVNPWTSVVTSLHINVQNPRNKKAMFKFFDRSDWENMVESGGRIADMARKADLDTELENLRTQIEEMQARTISRLGRNFEMLLGGQHAFSDFDAELIKRYVCLGEDDNLTASEGRFADMTKSAELYVDVPHFAYPITMSDTPGVNDPFLVREAVTLSTLGQSDMCVIVLSAHQALSSADLALMRILINLKHEQIVLFVNRIDELADPATQIGEIEGHIRKTLTDQNMPASIPLVFGSAAWAEAHVAGSLDVLPEDSITALEKLIEARQGTQDDAGNLSGLEDLSGMTALQRVLDEKVTENVCAPFARDIANRAGAIASQSRSLLSKTVKSKVAPVKGQQLDIEEIDAQVAGFLDQVDKKFETIRSDNDEKMKFEISGVFNGFMFHEGRALVAFMEKRGQMADWSPDTEGLRRNLNAVYNSVSDDMHGQIHAVYMRTHKIFETLYTKLSGETASEIGLAVPTHPKPQTPVSLMRTMSIDFSSGWISNWLALRLKRDSYIQKFRTVTLEQMHATLSEVQNQHVEIFCNEARKRLHAFVAMHLSTLKSHARLNSVEDRASLRLRLGTADAVDARIAELGDHISEFEHIASWLVDSNEKAKKIA